jgi:enterochelin esterase-like enzyme
MKKKALAVLLTIPLLALIAGIIFYTLQPRTTDSNLKDFLARAQASRRVMVDLAVAVPPDTPKDQIIYLSGSGPSLGNWDAAGVPLEHKDDGKWHGAIEVRNGIDYTYKVTRGTWGTVETNANGDALADRSLQVPDARTVNVTVADWVDHGQAVPGRVTMTGDIRLTKRFHSKILNNERTLIVYLPPGYDQNAAARYPVIYMQDGQNLFDEATSFAGVEWKMDEAAQKLIGTGRTPPFIIVGIYNTPDRTSEFTPPAIAANGKATDGSAAHGDLYGRFLVEELKPHIDQTYRTQADRAHTYIGGAALGGLASLSIAQAHPNIFSGVIALSPWLRQADHKLLPAWIGDGQWLKDERLYITMGDDPADSGRNYPGGAAVALADGKELDSALRAAGLQPDKDFIYREIPGGKHDEASWQKEIDPALRWLFPK